MLELRSQFSNCHSEASALPRTLFSLWAEGWKCHGGEARCGGMERLGTGLQSHQPFYQALPGSEATWGPAMLGVPSRKSLSFKLWLRDDCPAHCVSSPPGTGTDSGSLCCQALPLAVSVALCLEVMSPFNSSGRLSEAKRPCGEGQRAMFGRTASRK